MPVHRKNEDVGGLRVATVTIEGDPLNVLDLENCHEFTSCLHEIIADDRERVVILRGAGASFSAGVKIQEHTPELMPELLPAFHEIFHHLLKLRAITVAAVHGHCLGGAAELAFACDRVIAERSARIAVPEIRIGCFPPVAIPLLSHRAGQGTAARMICGGGEVSVEELARIGLVDRIADDGQLDSAIEEELALYGGKSPAVLGFTAGLLHQEAQRAWGDRIPVLEQEYLERLLPHPDVAEGIAAFLEKREPEWQDPDERPDPLDALR